MNRSSRNPAGNPTLGVRTTILVRDGKAVRLPAHLDRLLGSAGRLGLVVPRRREELATAVRDRAGAEPGPARLAVVLAGGAVRIESAPFAGYPDELYRRGAVAALAEELGHPLGKHAGLKVHPYDRLNDLRERARRTGAVDLILRDQDGSLLEGCASNLFLVRGGVLLTPPLTRPILPGITRAAVLAAAERHGIAVREEDLFPADIGRAEEAFLTGSLMEVLPLRRLGDVDFPPGETAVRLLDAIRG